MRVVPPRHGRALERDPVPAARAGVLEDLTR